MQVERYIAQARAWGIGHVYSVNRDHSPNNPELTRVSEILARHYTITYDKNLFDAKPTIEGFSPKSVLRRAKRLVKQATARSREDIRRYRHLIGTLREN